MKALAYLLGARALDIARDTGPRSTVPEVPMGPLASTEETASAWRRWTEAHKATEASAAELTGRRLQRSPAPMRSTHSPA